MMNTLKTPVEKYPWNKQHGRKLRGLKKSKGEKTKTTHLRGTFDTSIEPGIDLYGLPSSSKQKQVEHRKSSSKKEPRKSPPQELGDRNIGSDELEI